MSDTEKDSDRITSTAARLALVLGRLNRRMLRAADGLSQGTRSALASVVQFGPLRLNELAGREGIAAATITRVIADLENLGYVSRAVDQSDRRAYVVEATVKGITFIADERSARADVIVELLRTLDEADLDRIDATLPALEGMAAHERYLPSRRRVVSPRSAAARPVR